MEIRKARISDIRKIKEIANTCTPNIIAHLLFTYHLLNLYPFSEFLIAKDIAFLILLQNPISKNVFLYQLGVLPQHRKKGNGKKLMQEALKKYGGNKISFGVRKFNKYALNFYKQLGFNIVDEHFWFDKMFKMEKQA